MRSVLACDFTDQSFVIQVGELIPSSPEMALQYPEPLIQVIIDSGDDALNIIATAGGLKLIVDTLQTALAEQAFRLGQNAPGSDIPQ